MAVDTLLWLVALVAATATVFARYLRRRVVGDVEMMLVGFVVYIAGPFVVFALGWFADMPGIASWRDFFHAADARSAALLLFSAALAAAYALGRSGCRSRVGCSLDRPIPQRTVFALLILTTGFWGLLVAGKRHLLFGGYGVDYDVELIGQLGTINLLVVVVLLNSRQYGRRGWLYRGFQTLFVANSIALLSLGGRMYVLTGLVALLLQSLTRHPGVRSRLGALLVLITVLAGLVAVGVWRIGAAFEADFYAYIATAEGLFTSMSLGSFLSNNGMPALALPWNFAGSVANFIPSAIVGDKSTIVPSIIDAGYFYEAPLGATHVYVALLGNFGWLGAPCFAAALGWSLAALRRVDRRGWWLYHYVCALLPFMFFRDGFSIFNKAAVYNGVILVALVLLADRLSWGRFRLRPSARRSIGAAS